MSLLKYPPSLSDNTYVMFAPSAQTGIKENQPSNDGTNKIKNKVIHYNSNENPIYLYHPGMSKSNSQLQWEDTDVGRATDAVFGEGGGFIDRFKSVFGGSFTDNMTDLLTGGKARDVLSKKRGKILDPKKSLFFRGMGLREHQFTFEFAPETAKSAEEVRQIILRFKQYSHAEINLEGGYLKYPPTWMIESVVNGKTLMNYKPSIITAVNTDLSPNQIQAPFVDGKPVHIKLEVSFKEQDIVTSKDFVNVNQGYGY